MLHGGPGWPHNYMLPLKQQACRGRDVVFYDQAGCGKSSLPDAPATLDEFREKYPFLLDPNYYATEELPALIEHLGYGKYHILGSSWGTMLAQLFALNSNRTDGLESMALSGPISDTQLYIESQWDSRDGSLGSLPPFIRSRINALEAESAYDSTEYQAIDAVLTGFFTVRTQPPPDCFLDSTNQLNPMIYVGMQGPSEFAISGTLRYFNATPRLFEIRIPILLTSGTYDTVRPPVVDAMERSLSIVERYTFDKSGHCSMIDEPAKMNSIVSEFYDRVEASIIEGASFRPKEKYQSVMSQFLTRLYSIDLWAISLIMFIVGMFVGNRATKRPRWSGGYQPIAEA